MCPPGPAAHRHVASVTSHEPPAAGEQRPGYQGTSDTRGGRLSEKQEGPRAWPFGLVCFPEQPPAPRKITRLEERAEAQFLLLLRLPGATPGPVGRRGQEVSKECCQQQQLNGQKVGTPRGPIHTPKRYSATNRSNTPQTRHDVAGPRGHGTQ